MIRDAWVAALGLALGRLDAWESRWPVQAIEPPTPQEREALEALTERLTGNYPFFHSDYAGQMIKPPHPVAWAAYATAMAINPNNHALDGGPPTARMELEVVADIAAMFGFSKHLGHLSASGTIANLEALWVARELHPNKGIAVCENAHYTHNRVAGVLRMPVSPVASDASGRLCVASLRDVLENGDIGTVVATPGTTGLGAVDPIAAVADLCAEFGARLHVDAAYGGFFRLLAQREEPLVDAAAFDAISRADSVVVDPHKHGLQPYGCGCVLFADPSVGRIYRHDSPYTYFTSDELHLGEISLECSRAGASAAALWTTLRAIPLSPEAGLGARLACGRRAAIAWAQAIESESRLRLVQTPDTDIVVFATRCATSSETSRSSQAIFEAGMHEGEGAFYLATYKMPSAMLAARWSDFVADEPTTLVLRTVLMKPEHEAHWPRLHQRVIGALED
ncbi:MAG: glutamate/tyrosine decarboxylase-like PLP-dependent enzyme [Bradymonadia bacterium]